MAEAASLGGSRAAGWWTEAPAPDAGPDVGLPATACCPAVACWPAAGCPWWWCCCWCCHAGEIFAPLNAHASPVAKQDETRRYSSRSFVPPLRNGLVESISIKRARCPERVNCATHQRARPPFA